MTTAEAKAPAFVPLDVRTCARCGFDFPRIPRPGRPHRYCPSCRAAGPVAPPAAPPRDRRERIDPASPGYRLAADLTACRLAIEIARSALRIGRTAEALAALEQAEAPSRRTT